MAECASWQQRGALAADPCQVYPIGLQRLTTMGVAVSQFGRLFVKHGDACGGGAQGTATAAPGGAYLAGGRSRVGRSCVREVLFFPDGELPCRSYMGTGVCCGRSAPR